MKKLLLQTTNKRYKNKIRVSFTFNNYAVTGTGRGIGLYLRRTLVQFNNYQLFFKIHQKYFVTKKLVIHLHNN